MEKQNNVPKLRFPEFSDGWERKKFDEILDITRLAGYEYSSYWKEDENKEIIALRGYNIGRGKLELNNLGYISNELSLKLGRSKLFKGDIVYPCVGTIGNAVVIEEDDKYHIQQNIAKLTPKPNISPYLIAQFLMSDYGLNEVYKFNATSSQPNVLVGSLRNFEISLSTLPEQQKIATFLSIVDEKLQALKKKKSLLETYKKGVMQKLFSQEIRFKDDEGDDFEDWEVKKLGEICSLITKGTTPSQFSKISTDVNFIKIESISVGGKIDISKTLKITDFCHKSLLRSQLRKGDILFSIAGTLGRVAVIEEKDLPANTNQALSIIRLINSKQLNFLKYHLTTDYISKYIESCTTVGAQPNINLQQVNELLVNLPSLSEQTKIANFLTVIDKKINKVDAQIKQTELWKKGLLQGMFV